MVYLSNLKLLKLCRFLAKTLSILHGNEELEPRLPPLVVTIPPKEPLLKSNRAINIISSITIPAPSSPALTPSTPKTVAENETPETAVVENLTPAKVKGKAKVFIFSRFKLEI